MDQRLVERNEEKGYKTCDECKEKQGNEKFDSGFVAWKTCLVSAIINMVLFGIVACQGIHLLVLK